jgi:hypothetical protein
LRRGLLITRRGRRRFSVSHATGQRILGLGLLAVTFLTPALASARGPLSVIALADHPRLACASDDSDSFLTFKGRFGVHVTRTPADYALRVERRLLKTAGRLAALAGPDDDSWMARRRARLVALRVRLVALADELIACDSGAIFDVEPMPPGFELLCLHGFYAPSVASAVECAINLSARLDAAEAPAVVATTARGSARRTSPPTLLEPTWEVEPAVAILDELLGDACGRTDGVYLRNTNVSDQAPLYHGYCAHEGAPVRTNYEGAIATLGMTEEPTGPCLISGFRKDESEDDCGDYSRPSPGGGGGSGGGGMTPPDDGDCFIVRMTEEPTGCE